MSTPIGDAVVAALKALPEVSDDDTTDEVNARIEEARAQAIIAYIKANPDSIAP